MATNLQFLHGKNIADNTIITPGTFYLDTENNELWYDDPAKEKTGHIRLFDAHFNSIFKQLEDIQYEQVAVEKFELTNVEPYIEYGNIIYGDLIFEWAANKPPSYLIITDLSTGINTEDLFEGLDNQTITGGTATVSVIEENSIVSTRSYRLTLGDNRTRDDKNYPDLEDATKDVTITFCYPVFYGAIEKGTSITSDVLRSLTKQLQTTREGSFTIDCGTAEDNLISLFAIPASYGTPTFTVGGFLTTYPVEVVSYTSDTDNQYTIDYNVYFGTNIGLGEHTIVVS